MEREESGRRTNRVAYLLSNVIFLGIELLVVFLVFWAGRELRSIFEFRAREMTIRAVLKPHLSDEQANSVAEKIHEGSPGVELVVLGQAEARALLSLQEPWMENLPTIELPALPAIIEIRHPDILKAPQNVERFNETVERLPEVDFVMFNSIGHEELASAARSISAFSNFLVFMIVCLMVVAHVVFNLASSRLKGRHGPAWALAVPAAVTVAAFALAWVAFSGIRVFAVRNIHELGTLPLWFAGACVVGAFLLQLLLELKSATFYPVGAARRRRKR